MKTKRLIALLIVSVMMFAFSGVNTLAEGNYDLLNMDSALPITKEPFTLSILSSYDSSIDVDFEAEGQQIVWKWLEANTNLKFDFDLVVEDIWSEQRSIKLASGDVADVIMHGFSNNRVMRHGMNEGLFIQLDEFLADKALTPYINQVYEERPALKAASTLPDGHIYGVGYYMTDLYETVSGVRAFWDVEAAKAAGVDCTAIETLDDLHEAFKKLKGSDFNGNGIDDEIPWSGYSNNWKYLLEYVLNAYGLVGCEESVDARSGEACYAPLTEQYKEALQYMATLYAEGLLDGETFTQSDQDYAAKGQAGQFAFFTNGNPGQVFPKDKATAATDLRNTTGDYDSIQYYGKPVVDVAGNTPVCKGDYGIGPNRCFISNNCEHPEVAIRFLDYLSSPEGSMIFRGGPEYGNPNNPTGNGWEFDPETDSDMRFANAWARAKEVVPGIDDTIVGYYKYITVFNFAMDPVGYIGSDEYRGLREEYPGCLSNYDFGWMTCYVNNVNQYEVLPFPKDLIYASDAEKEFTDTRLTDLNSYVDSSAAKLITGVMSFDEYDSFIEGMKKLGAEEYNDIVVKQYEAFQANN